MGQKLYTRWVWDGDGDEFLLWGWGWDHDTRTRPAPLPSLMDVNSIVSPFKNILYM